MKTKRIITALALAALSLTTFAQAPQQRPQMSEEQRMEMKAVREKYSPEIEKLKNDIAVKQAKQKSLLSSKEIDEKAVYANIDAMGALKADLQKKEIAMRSEMKKINPNAGNRNPQARPSGAREGGQMHARPRSKQMGNKPQCRSGMENGQCGDKMAQQNRAGAQGQRQGQKPQKNCKSGGKKCGMGQLSEDQKAKAEEIKKTHFWLIQETEKQLELLKVQNKNVDNATRLAAIDKISALETQLAKQQMAMKLDMRKILTEEQLMQMIERQGKKGKKNRR